MLGVGIGIAVQCSFDFPCIPFGSKKNFFKKERRNKIKYDVKNVLPDFGNKNKILRYNSPNFEPSRWMEL